jgi:hypothetical protein
MHRFASTLASLALATFVSAPALADCVPGTGLCASAGVTVGIPAVQVGGQITIGIPPIVLPLPYAAQQPGAAPPPPPAPVYQPPPPQAYWYPPQQAPRLVYAPPTPIWGSPLALDLRLDGAGGFGGDRRGNPWGYGGAGLGLRYRATPHFGVELGVDLLGGRDYNDNKSTEISGNLGGLLYVNPRSRAQLYFSGGLLADHAKTSIDQPTTLSGNGITTQVTPPQYDHVGGYAGLGLEMFLTRHFALHADMRGMVRQRVGANAASAPEFTDPTNGRTSNTSVGLLGSVGALFYF